MKGLTMAMHATNWRRSTSRKVLGSLGMLAAWLVLCGTAQAATRTTVTYVYTNAQGTPLARADAQGNVIARYSYRPYGTQQSGPTHKGPGYTGHVDDPDTGLVYMQQRYYDPAVGRFLSPDPVAPTPGNIFNFGRYTYANDNPIVNIDPTGACSSQDCPGPPNLRDWVPEPGNVEWFAYQRWKKNIEELFQKHANASSSGTTWHPSWYEPVLCDTGAACAQAIAQMRYLHGDITKQQLMNVYQAQATGALIGLGADALLAAGRPVVRYAVAHPRKVVMMVCVAFNVSGCGPERAGELAQQMRTVNKMFNEGKIEQAARVLRKALTK